MNRHKAAPPPQDQPAALVKQKIIEAASILFEKQGLHETSVAEIAELAGISVPVTYNYVKRKADTVLLIMEHFTDKFKVRVAPEIELIADAEAKLRQAFEVFCRLVDEDLIKVVLIYRYSRVLDRDGRRKIMAAEAEHAQIFEEILKQGQEQGVFQPGDPNLLGYSFLMAAHAWALKTWHFKKRFTLEQYIEQQLSILLAAVIK